MTEKREAKLVVSAQDNASRPLARIGQNLANLGRRAGLARLGQQFGNVRRALGGVAGAAGGAVRALGSLLGLSGGAGLAGLVMGLRNSAGELDKLAKIGRDLGMPVQELRQLGYISGMVGVDVGALHGALRNSARGFDQMRNGVGRLHGQLRNTNPELHRQLMAARDSREAFGLMLDAIRQTGTEAERIRLSEMFFGSAEMVRIATMSVEEMRDLRAEADRIIGQVTDDQANAVEAYNDAVGKLGEAFKGLSDAIAVDLLPALTPMASQFAEGVAANREFIALNVSETVQKIAAAVAAVDWAGFARGVGNAFTIMDRFAGMVGGWSNVVIGLTTVAMWPLGKAIAVVAFEMGKLAAVILANPIGIAATAIAGLALVIWRNWEDLGPRFAGLWSSLGDMAGGFVDIFKGLMTGDLVGAAQGVIRMFTGWKDAWLSVFDILGGIVRAFATEIDGIFGTDLVGGIDRMNAFFAGIPEVWGRAMSAVSAMLSAWWDRESVAFFGAITVASEKLAGLFDQLHGAWERALNSVKGALQAFVGWFDEVFIRPIMRGIDRITGAFDGVRNATSWFFGGAEPAAGAPEGRARGGPVSGGVPYEVGERGRELFIPEQDGTIVPNNLLRRIVDSGAVQRGGSGTIQGAAELNVRFDNAPQGIRASASSDGRLFRRIALDTGRRMKPAYG